MQFRYRLVAAWVLATVASILVAFAAVASVRTAIADPPSALLLPGESSPPLDLPPLSEVQQTTVPDPEVVDGAPVGNEDSNADEEGAVEEVEPVAVTTTQPSVATTSPPQQAVPTSVAPSTSTTPTTSPPTTQPPADTFETYETEGGWVTVRSSSQGAYLESASPKPGWTVESEGGRGPEHFTVVFKGHDKEIHFKVEFEDGRVKIDIEG